MKTIKTIQQHTTTYTISQQGNCSYSVKCTPAIGDQVKHIPIIFDSVQAAEDYIATCNGIDLAIAVSSGMQTR